MRAGPWEGAVAWLRKRERERERDREREGEGGGCCPCRCHCPGLCCCHCHCHCHVFCQQPKKTAPVFGGGDSELSAVNCRYEHPVVAPQDSHLRQVPFLTRVSEPHSGQGSPS